MSSPVQVALIHQIDPKRARNSWSGSLRSSVRAIERHVGEVTDLGPPPINLFPYRAARRLLAAVGRNYSFEHDVALGRRYGRYFSGSLAGAGFDLVYAPSGSQTLAFIETEIPTLYLTDATWRVMQGYYSYYSNLVRRTAVGGEELERRALERATIVVMPSQWAADSAINDYGIDPAKVHVIPYGANLADPPRREEVLPARLGQPIRLLLVGISWEIKGGAIALETLIALLKLGIDAELAVVGCSPPNGVSHPRMHVYPFLDKSIPAERDRLERLWKTSDFFLLPTRSEAAGIVYAEASAYALPSIGTRTGGVPSMVTDGVNGYLLPPEARGDRYAGVIAGLVDDPERYAALCLSSREEFETRLNWDAWGRGVAGAIATHLPALAGRMQELK
jgi:glycosyltransferase involved in cell wall biosynthesis